MGMDPRWEMDLVDEEDTGEVPREVLESVLARIRAEEALRERALRAVEAQAQRLPQDFELDGSLDGRPPLALASRLWSPGTYFIRLGGLALTCGIILWWMVAG